MALNVPVGGEALALQYLVNKSTPQNLILKLFKNDITPGETDVVGDYTEANFTGYSAITLTGSSWTVNGASSPAVASYAQQSFVSTAGSQNQAVYGYYLVRASGGELVYSERFADGPYTIQNNGDTIRVTPTINGD